ncbi:hypothetical protein [Planomonospora venezuelensis]|uniref:Uncharacterized protein n=1 Tax=Planomonospora venezuelensis TaxID=1999 RepID=A0A841D0E1_PLAVE|nr:hypothetical protein [Planomonospora venezuelensis]MBB5962979.1 hypothetical protein [Planomonospora venezuelensis]GIN00547.1 hypothetical protein Pve01_22050 [Planomonospora venezuelensis]
MNKDELRTSASGGVPVTDDLVDRLAEEAEAGYDVEVLRSRGGRWAIGSADR